MRHGARAAPHPQPRRRPWPPSDRHCRRTRLRMVAHTPQRRARGTDTDASRARCGRAHGHGVSKQPSHARRAPPPTRQERGGRPVGSHALAQLPRTAAPGGRRRTDDLEGTPSPRQCLTSRSVGGRAPPSRPHTRPRAQSGWGGGGVAVTPTWRWLREGQLLRLRCERRERQGSGGVAEGKVETGGGESDEREAQTRCGSCMVYG